MNSLQTPHCSRCKRTGVPLVKYSKKLGRQYYQCRDCNRNRAKKYYATKAGSLAIKRAIKKYYKENRIKVNAIQAVYYSVITGKISRPTACSCCGNSGGRIEGHHINYNEPMKVVWLCSGCHADADRKLLDKPIV